MTLVVVKAVGLVTVQDLGRSGYMHLAMPPGGALVPELLVAANRAVHNADGAAALEVQGQLVVRAEAAMVVATDLDVSPRELAAGDPLTIESGPRRSTYLAIRGGIAAPIVLGGRGALLCAELGRPLRAGDVVRADESGTAQRPSSSSAPAQLAAIGTRSASAETPTRITVIPGPDLDAFSTEALERLVSAPYRVLPSSDRVGTRLAGASLARTASYRERSRPMVIGALEVPGDGQPIVLGPEHPTTGGYPIIAVIATAELGRFFAIRLGGWVQFELRG